MLMLPRSLRESSSARSSLWSLLILPLVCLGLLAGSATLTLGDEAAPKTDPKVEPAPKTEPPKVEPKPEPKPEPKVEPKAEPKSKDKSKRGDKGKSTDTPKTDDKAAKTADKPAPKAEIVRALPANDKAAWTKNSPESVADLKAIQARVQELVKISIPRVVGLRVGQASGSGVIISKEGYILTAGHVSALPNKPVDIILHDGKVIRGKTLGRNKGIDSGLIKINEGEEWDFAEMGDSESLKSGEWCVAIGHPGGYMRGRPPVVRLGRIISANDRVIQTDATLVGGDSGGPLFDMNGKVIAIHSRIAARTSDNYHVPVETYRSTWDRLAAGEDWTDREFTIGAFAGFNLEPHAKGGRVTGIAPNSPSTLASLQIGDVITKFDGAAVKDLTQVSEAINSHRPNEQIDIELLRDGKTVKVKLTLAAGYKAGPFIGLTGETHAKGVIAANILPGTPADAAKLLKDDIITTIDGNAVKDLIALQTIIGKKKPGETAELEVLRGTETLKLKVVLGLRG